jgi:hypothetical protein
MQLESILFEFEKFLAKLQVSQGTTGLEVGFDFAFSASFSSFFFQESKFNK